MQQQIQNSQHKWYQKITVEPTMVLYMLAFMLTSVVEQVFFVYKACTANHNYPHEICIDIQNHDSIKREVQVSHIL
jgi:MFS transporter, PCFT/HCP family, solute carrier family 46, member 3